MKKLIANMVLMGCMTTQAQFVSSDTALLVELVTTTASQLNELEKLVSNAEKYTQKMQQYNEIVQDQYFKTERTLYLAESLAAKSDIEGLGDINTQIANLKYNIEDIKALMKEYGLIKQEEAKTKAKAKRQTKTLEMQDKIAKSQVSKSANAKSQGRANQLTAQNTALIYESNVDIHKTQIEILEKTATTNRLLAEEQEEKKQESLKRLQTYGAGKK